MFLQETPTTMQDFLNIETASLVAGLLGIFINLLHKSEGSLQARISGFVIALGTILYLFPLLVWLIQWKGGIILNAPVKNFTAFVLGLVAQRLTESFIDNPLETVLSVGNGLRKVKRSIFNGESLITKAPDKIFPQDETKKE